MKKKCVFVRGPREEGVVRGERGMKGMKGERVKEEKDGDEEGVFALVLGAPRCKQMLEIVT